MQTGVQVIGGVNDDPGTIAIVLDIDYADGLTRDVTAQVTDVAGNTSVLSDILTVTVDQSVSDPAFALGSDTGASALDAITSNGLVNVTLDADVASWRIQPA